MVTRSSAVETGLVYAQAWLPENSVELLVIVRGAKDSRVGRLGTLGMLLALPQELDRRCGALLRLLSTLSLHVELLSWLLLCLLNLRALDSARSVLFSAVGLC